ncbi:polyamine aminopropyltransferase [Sessilibacter corallicola]|uniref:polyamine aminopropyltransferase n=1 Tax=Sessilibacter corallicola TaxID=2904075 RepID=UPI001E3B778B|nr:polyamine aminopropyltransferase [Sessilibacter corallicola]MCE2027520.1 polyamine aminopropyltransferase [Sessilibacter corallicola]
MNRYSETLYDAWGQSFAVDKVLFETHTDHQHLVIFKNSHYGRVMALDGVIQTTEADEFIYHESLTHIPLLAHGDVKKVLIIGGGDGGILREVCKHKNVESITMVEIDNAVVEMSREHLPKHSDGAFDDSRFQLVIDDGANFVAETEQTFDVIISDSTDPIGPGEVLFTQDFYGNCKRCLNPGGVLVTQNGVPFMQADELISTHERQQVHFADNTFYTAAIPTYVGGVMAFSWASDNKDLRAQNLEIIKARFEQAELAVRFYTPELHLGAFALPGYIQEHLK